MTDELTPDEIRGALRDYFAGKQGPEAARRLRDAEPEDDAALLDAGFDREDWRVLAEQVGLAAMAAPEELGGLGLGTAHLVAAVEECGRHLTPGPIRATALVSWALRGVAVDGAPEELTGVLERFFVGDVIVGASQCEEAAAEYVDGRVTGRLATVTHGPVADLVITPVNTQQGPAVALVLIDGACTAREELPDVDLTARLAHVVVDEAAAVLVTAPGDEAALARHEAVARLLLAAEQVGGAEGCLAGMVDYAKVRSQFGQLIGTYQAIQHHCSRTTVETVAARALVAAGASAIDVGDAEQAEALSLLARGEAGEVFHTATRTLIQVSGGIGFTWEHDAHLYFRRARATASVAGSPARQRSRAVEAGCLDLLVAAV